MDRIDKSEKSLQSEKKTIKSLELHGRKEIEDFFKDELEGKSHLKEFVDSLMTKPNGFTLGNLFDTSRVELMRYMFHSSTLPEGFSLGNNFCTANVSDMQGMFKSCMFPGGFSFGNNVFIVY